MTFTDPCQLQTQDLLRLITQLQEQNAQLKEQIEQLEAEIRRLKKLPAKPDIKPNTKPSGNGEDGSDGEQPVPEGNDDGDSDSSPKKRKVKKPNENTRKQRKQPPKPPAEHSVTVAASDVPKGSTFNGCTPFYVQELTIQASSIEYLLEQWVTPDGKTITAKPPGRLHGHHYGPMLQAYILHQYHGCSVTQPELLDWLWDIGISISSGELSQLLTTGHELFHAEKDELLTTGIRCSSYIQADDTGTRHNGKNGICTIINNESFAWFESTGSKSRENFLSLLHRPWSTYSLTDNGLTYLEKLDYPRKWLRKLEPYRGVTFLSHEAWKECMKELGLTGRRRQQASEAMIYGSLIEHGAGHLTTFSDGARQFDVFKHSQCWIHAERGLAKVHPVNDQQAMAQKWLRTWFWAIYNDLKEFKSAPTDDKANSIRHGFEILLQTRTCSELLQSALSGLAVIKKELLLVLTDPRLPLHNNLSESQIREYVKRRKVSGGTRSTLGRQCRDTFASLKKTCRLYGLSFWDYLTDRLTGSGVFPSLADLIERNSRALPSGLELCSNY